MTGQGDIRDFRDWCWQGVERQPYRQERTAPFRDISRQEEHNAVLILGHAGVNEASIRIERLAEGRKGTSVRCQLAIGHDLPVPEYNGRTSAKHALSFELHGEIRVDLHRCLFASGTADR